MKKFFILGLALASTFFATAQEAEEESADIVTEGANDVPLNKKGQVITPQAGDIGISVEADPFLDFAGDLINFNGTASSNPTTVTTADASTTDTRLIGRYFLDETTAIRGIFRFTASSTTNRTSVDKLKEDNGAAVIDYKDENLGIANKVVDKSKNKSTDFLIGGGLEKRRGYGRLQGFYGGQATIGFSSSSSESTFGNNLRERWLNAGSPTTLDGDTKTKNGLSISFGVQAFIGVEYFFARKMAVGGEFSWGPSFSTEAKSKTTTQRYNGTDEREDTIEEEAVFNSSNNSSTGLNTNTSGNVYLSFFF